MEKRVRKYIMPFEESSLPKVSLAHRFAHAYDIIHRGKKIGSIEIPTDLEGDTYSISDVNIKPQYRRMGLGTAVYVAAIQEFDKPIESFMSTPEAERVWNRLVRMGLARKTEYGYISTK